MFEKIVSKYTVSFEKDKFPELISKLKSFLQLLQKIIAINYVNGIRNLLIF